jgi:hypothetical protein
LVGRIVGLPGVTAPFLTAMRSRPPSKKTIARNDTFLLGLMVGAFLILFIAAGAVEMASVNLTREVAPKEASASPSQSNLNIPVAVAQSTSPGGHALASPIEVAPAAAPASTKGVTGSVDDSDLKELASAVHLLDGKVPAPDKEAWTRELPVAQELARKTCDCEQRNWLNRFILTGNAVLGGSNQYYCSAQVLSSMSHEVLGLDADVVAK